MSDHQSRLEKAEAKFAKSLEQMEKAVRSSKEAFGVLVELNREYLETIDALADKEEDNGLATRD